MSLHVIVYCNECYDNGNVAICNGSHARYDCLLGVHHQQDECFCTSVNNEQECLCCRICKFTNCKTIKSLKNNAQGWKKIAAGLILKDLNSELIGTYDRCGSCQEQLYYSYVRNVSFANVKLFEISGSLLRLHEKVVKQFNEFYKMDTIQEWVCELREKEAVKRGRCLTTFEIDQIWMECFKSI